MNKDLLKSPQWRILKEHLSDAKSSAEEDAFNIFSVSTYSYALENFHSDVWGMLLDPNGPHKTGKQFLDLFLIFLRKHYQLEIGSYVNPIVHREKHRIDIFITDSNNHCIIIENKINDAKDQTNQVDRYIDKARSEHFEIDAFIYVSLSGQRHSSSDLGIQITGIAASDKNENCLLKGWIEPCILCIEEKEKNERVYSFLLQYSYLLNFLTPSNYFKMSLELLYEMVNDIESFETALLIEENLEKIKLHRLEIFNKRMGSMTNTPFTKKGIYPSNPNYLIYSGWKYQNARFKLGIVIYKDRTEFVLYDETGDFKDASMCQLLEKIQPDGFKFLAKERPANHFEFIIRLGDKNLKALKDLDDLTVSVTKELFKNIRDVHSKQDV